MLVPSAGIPLLGATAYAGVVMTCNETCSETHRHHYSLQSNKDGASHIFHGSNFTELVLGLPVHVDTPSFEKLSRDSKGPKSLNCEVCLPLG